jgi:hypothetical protein
MSALTLRHSKALTLVLAIIAVVILLLPFHAFLTIWVASNFGHYTTARLWKEGLVTIAGLVVIWWLITDPKVRHSIFSNKLSWLILVYAVLDLVLALIARQQHHVSSKALAYGLLDDLRFLAMFIICYAAAIKSKVLNAHWQKLILWPAVIVVLFGLLQMSILPANVLTHFGYGPKTIMPFETINNNSRYVRILSTLRGADPLGAYLILPISALGVLLAKFKGRRKDWLALALLIGALVVLFGSYSRSAWIGAVLAAAVIGLVVISKDWLRQHQKLLISALIFIIILAGIGFVAFSHSSRFQNIFYHTQTNSKAAISSNQAHLSALKDGLKQVYKHPFGEGPGSSGPASVYNHDRPPLIPENYFLSVGAESGWLGMGLFMAINIYLGWLLWQRRRSSFALTLFASLIGISFVNLLTLGWTDDTICYIWWGLAGLCIAVSPKDSAEKLTAH